MDIGKAAVSGFRKLESTDGIYVRNLSQADIEEIDEKLKGIDDLWQGLRAKAEFLLCDKDGNTLEGVGSVEELKTRLSLGQVRDLIREAEELLILGKWLATHLRRSESKPG